MTPFLYVLTKEAINIQICNVQNVQLKSSLMQRDQAFIDYCPSCKGVWLDRGEIDKIAQIQSSDQICKLQGLLMTEEWRVCR